MSDLTLKIEVDKIDRQGWESLINKFSDATLSQVWPQKIEFMKNKSLSHIVIRMGEEILGCCQVELRVSPIPRIGIAYIQWGPLYIKRGQCVNNNILRQLIRGIKDEYAIKRGYLIRISPHAKGDIKGIIKQIIEDEGFKRNTSERPWRTFIIDLAPPIDVLRNNLSQNWRRHLNKAEKNGLTVEQGTSADLYNIFIKLGHEMVKRKNLTQAHLDSFEQHRRLQQELPEQFKMQIMICKTADEPICATICSAIGDTGIYAFAATGEKALKLDGAYLLQWHAIKWLKENGIRYYDLGAFNPQRNPGGYQFKLGLAGKKGWDETFIGEYYGCFNFTGQLAKFILEGSKYLSEINSKLKNDIKNNLPRNL